MATSEAASANTAEIGGTSDIMVILIFLIRTKVTATIAERDYGDTRDLG